MKSESQIRIVAFTKDWNDVPTCTTHVLREMGKRMPVLWVESIGTRKVNVVLGKDWKRVWRRLLRAVSGAESKENQLRVLAPLVIPKAESWLVQRLNRVLMRLQIGRELRRMGRGPVEYWCFVPNAVDLLPKERIQNPDRRTRQSPCEGMGAKRQSRIQNGSVVCGLKSDVTRSVSRVIYYCVDDWSQFHNLDGVWLSRKEEELLRRADIVFAASRFLVEKCSRHAGDKVVYLPHGVDHDLFARALDQDLKEPADLAEIPHPRIGFYGNLHSWVDFGLLEGLALTHPQWRFVLIGEVYCEVTRLRELKNVHFLGRREHRQLPAYCRGFDVGIIPYDMRQVRMESVNPVKTKELLAAGVPVVAADIPELRGMADVVVCRTREDWESAISRQLERRDHAEISRRVAGESWVAKVQSIRERIALIPD